MESTLPNIDTDKAYLLGLIIGGGEIIGSRLLITLPYRNWGSLRINPERAGDISGYILTTLRPIWKNAYGLELSYTVENNAWKIYCEVDADLKKDLALLSLPIAGKLKDTASIATLVKTFNNSEKSKRFIAGLTDTVGSLAKSHRHRVDGNQIISYEFSGKNFSLISELVGLFYSIDCNPDQILWNHPNFHSGTNRYYNSWRKGFKLRIKLKDYMVSGNFVSEAKKLSAEENMQLQAQLPENSQTKLSINGRTSLHKDEDSDWLPSNVRGLHFIHYTHLLYCLGAPISNEAYTFLRKKLETPEKLVSPFTLLTKGPKKAIHDIIDKEEYLSHTTYTNKSLDVHEITRSMSNPERECMYGIDETRGFPKATVLHAVTYLALAETKSDKLKGTRVLGSISEAFDTVKDIIPSLNITIAHPSKGTCLLIESGEYAALVGYVDDEFNKKVISVDDSNLRLRIRNPLYEECLDL